MEDKELREKLLCVLRNNIQDFEMEHINNTFCNYLYFNNIYLYFETVRKHVEVRIQPKYFWQKEKVYFEEVKDYSTFRVSYKGFEIKLTKEEYEEIMQIRQEKIKEKQLKELEKLCNNN